MTSGGTCSIEKNGIGLTDDREGVELTICGYEGWLTGSGKRGREVGDGREGVFLICCDPWPVCFLPKREEREMDDDDDDDERGRSIAVDSPGWTVAATANREGVV